MKKKIFFITTCRADYGYIEELLNEASKSLNNFSIYLIISGNHFSTFFGNSHKLIKKFKNITKIKIYIPYLNKEITSTIKTINHASEKFGKLLKKKKPDLVVTFGDRFEMFAFSLATYTHNIKQAHIAGGEITKGSLDDGYRHCMTKFSNYHFPVTDKYKKHLIKMGENPKTIFNVGNLGLDKIKKINFLSKNELNKKLGINLLNYNFLVVFHPETSEIYKTNENFQNLISAISEFKNINFIFTSPGEDFLSKKFVYTIRKFAKRKKNIYFYKNLGSKIYLSLLKNSNGIIGNSSSGISEAPMLNIPTLNIGNRQKGRISMNSIYNCSSKKNEIIRNIRKILKKKNYKNLNLYGNGNAAKKIVMQINEFNLSL